MLKKTTTAVRVFATKCKLCFQPNYEKYGEGGAPGMSTARSGAGSTPIAKVRHFSSVRSTEEVICSVADLRWR